MVFFRIIQTFIISIFNSTVSTYPSEFIFKMILCFSISLILQYLSPLLHNFTQSFYHSISFFILQSFIQIQFAVTQLQFTALHLFLISTKSESLKFFSKDYFFHLINFFFIEVPNQEDIFFVVIFITIHSVYAFAP